MGGVVEGVELFGRGGDGGELCGEILLAGDFAAEPAFLGYEPLGLGKGFERCVAEGGGGDDAVEVAVDGEGEMESWWDGGADQIGGAVDGLWGWAGKAAFDAFGGVAQRRAPKTREALCPPKPRELDMMLTTLACRAVLGT